MGTKIQIQRQLFFLPQRTDTTEYIACQALRLVPRTHGRFLAAVGAGQTFQIQLMSHRHHGHHRLFIHQCQQRLEDGLRGQLQGVRRFQPVALRLGIMVITVQLKGNAGLFRSLHRRCHTGLALGLRNAVALLRA